MKAAKSFICFFFLLFCGVAAAQSAPRMLKVLLISDIHFDPFHDRTKVSQLAATPVSEWDQILAKPDAPTWDADYTALQKACNATVSNINTPYPLLLSTMQALQKNAADVRFIAMSGDILTHQFPCRFRTILPSASSADMDTFIAKTMEFVAEKLKEALPHATLYLSLGNNDSNCEDYKLDTNTPLLASLGKIVGHSMGSPWNAAAAKSFAVGGYYSVTMAAPMQRTRLIVVNDIFLAATYKSCAGAENPAPGAAQMQWLQSQLDEARRLHQQVWVMGHIPPGVNPFTTAKKGAAKICAPPDTPDAGPAVFMKTEVLGDTLVRNSDVVKLAIFGHTHTDEMRLLGTGEKSVAVKIVPSVTPVYGNNPAFTVAQVDTAKAAMADYTIFASADAAGSSWAKEYNFSEAYGYTGYTPATLRAVIGGFRADTEQKTLASRDYLHFYAVGKPQIQLPAPVWEAGVCALDHTHAAEYTGCVCGQQ